MKKTSQIREQNACPQALRGKEYTMNEELEAVKRQVNYEMQFLTFRIINDWIYIENIPNHFGFYVKGQIDKIKETIVSMKYNEETGDIEQIKVEGIRDCFGIAANIRSNIISNLNEFVEKYYKTLIEVSK